MKGGSVQGNKREIQRPLEKRSQWLGYEKGLKRERGERKGDKWPVGHLQGGRRMHGTHEGLFCLFRSTMGNRSIDDPPRAPRPKGNDIHVRRSSTMLRVEGGRRFWGCPCLLSSGCSGHEVLIPARPDQGKREGVTVRA